MIGIEIYHNEHAETPLDRDWSDKLGIPQHEMREGPPRPAVEWHLFDDGTGAVEAEVPGQETTYREWVKGEDRESVGEKIINRRTAEIHGCGRRGGEISIGPIEDPIQPDGLERISSDPLFMGGEPRIRGTRITVGNILSLMREGATAAETADQLAPIEEADIKAALRYARRAVDTIHRQNTGRSER